MRLFAPAARAIAPARLLARPARRTLVLTAAGGLAAAALATAPAAPAVGATGLPNTEP